MNPHQRPDDPIRHFILFLLENHSFAQMLGCFRRVYPGFAGVDPDNPGVNRYDERVYRLCWPTTFTSVALGIFLDLEHVGPNHSGD
jgi:phospholipase C